MVIPKNPLNIFEHTRSLVQSAFDSITIGICVLDLEGQIIVANRGLYQMLGYNQREGLFEKCSDLIHPEDLALTLNNLDQFLVEKIDNITYRCRVLGKNDQTIDASISITLQRDVEESPQFFIVQIQDISRINTLEDQLIQAQKAETIGILAGGITHGFNNILSSILGNAEFALRHELKEDDPGAYSVQQIIKAAHRASFLVKQILTLSRRRKPELAYINLSPIASEVTKFFKATLPANIEIRLILKASNDIVRADPVLMYQVLMNLCTDAMDTMQVDGGELEIKLENATSIQDEMLETAGTTFPMYIKLSVSDTSTGMPTEIKEQIFDPSSVVKPGEKQTELGLSVVWDIVRDLEGNMFVTREPGKGSRFSVILPVSTVSTMKERISTETVAGGKERILFVDDDEQIVEFMVRALNVMGYQVTEKSSSIEAYEVFSNSPDQFDLIISDMNMDGLTGEQLASKIFAIRPEIPVIICTGYDELLTKERAVKLGIREIIMKPFTIDEMDAVIRQVLNDPCGSAQGLE